MNKIRKFYGGFTPLIVFIFVLIIAMGGVLLYQNTGKNLPVGNSYTDSSYDDKKIFYVDSYHEGYEWSDGVTAGIKSVTDKTKAELKIFRMDTKRNPGEDYAKAKALEAKAEIDSFKPDILITSDDNAFKYLVADFYKDADLPVVFCGINWDVSLYGAPYKNTTGMVEISLSRELVEMLSKYAKGKRIGYLSADTETERKNALYYKKLLDINIDKEYLVKDMAEWENAFLNLQKETDVIVFENNAGIKDWDDKRAEEFALKNSRVPVGTTNPWTMQSSLIGLTKIASEQGEWSANTALAILDGKSPSAIPVVQNKKGDLYVNLKMAEKLGIVFDPLEIKDAKVLR